MTGNYTFFNLLTIALCILLFDDRTWLERLPDWIHRHAVAAFGNARPRVEAVVTITLLVVVVPLGLLQMAVTLSHGVPARAVQVVEWIAPFGIVNSYGLFANMTTERIEIVVEGSRDGSTWIPYVFRYKPGNILRPPPVVAPYQPRLDWQMWFAALGSYRENPFFINMMVRLLEGSKPVLALLGTDPFRGSAPQYVRALAYRYRFTSWAERSNTGAWWNRELLGQYFPPVSLKSFSRREP